MEKLKVVKYSSVTIAMVGILLFWIFGCKGELNHAQWSISIAGICAYVYLACIWLCHRRQRWMA